jgi:hypothetical protein
MLYSKTELILVTCLPAAEMLYRCIYKTGTLSHNNTFVTWELLMCPYCEKGGDLNIIYMRTCGPN